MVWAISRAARPRDPPSDIQQDDRRKMPPLNERIPRCHEKITRNSSLLSHVGNSRTRPRYGYFRLHTLVVRSCSPACVPVLANIGRLRWPKAVRYRARMKRCRDWVFERLQRSSGVNTGRLRCRRRMASSWRSTMISSSVKSFDRTARQRVGEGDVAPVAERDKHAASCVANSTHRLLSASLGLTK